MTHFKAVFPVRIHITQEEMWRRMSEIDITKYLGEDVKKQDNQLEEMLAFWAEHHFRSLLLHPCNWTHKYDPSFLLFTLN